MFLEVLIVPAFPLYASLYLDINFPSSDDRIYAALLVLTPAFWKSVSRTIPSIIVEDTWQQVRFNIAVI